MCQAAFRRRYGLRLIGSDPALVRLLVPIFLGVCVESEVVQEVGGLGVHVSNL